MKARSPSNAQKIPQGSPKPTPVPRLYDVSEHSSVDTSFPNRTHQMNACCVHSTGWESAIITKASLLHSNISPDQEAPESIAREMSSIVGRNGPWSCGLGHL